DVFQAQFLACHIKRHVGETAVHRAQHPRQHCAVANTRVEHPQCRWTGMDTGKLERNPVRNHPLLAAGMDEQQVFLAVFEKAEIAPRIALLRRYLETARRWWATRGGRDIALDTLQGIDCAAL